MTSARFPSASRVSDAEIQALLQRLECPTAFYQVRAIFMGAIASPSMSVSPMETLAQVWGGELPEFATQLDLEEVGRVLLQGQWNRLTDHQNSRNPFRLLRTEVQATRAGLLKLAGMRVGEIGGFLDGLFGSAAAIHLPQKAHEAVVKLGELYFMHDAVCDMLSDESKLAPDGELKVLLRNLQQMAIIADELINKTIQSCKRARGQHMEAMVDDLCPHPLAQDDELMPAFGDSMDDQSTPDIVHSPLSQSISRHGVTVKVEIYGDSEGKWILEVEDRDRASHVWEERFGTDQAALQAAIEALDAEPAEFAGLPPSPATH